MSRRRGWAGAAVMWLALASSGCDVKVGEEGGLSVDFAGTRATDEWVRTYDIKPGGRLEIINVNGQISASPATGTTVEVRAIREVRANSEEASRELLRKTEMREDVTPDRVTIQGPEAPEGPNFRGPRMSIKYDVRVPAGLSVLLKTQNGEVSVEGVQGIRLEAATTNGGINARSLSGAIDASTVNGGIALDVAELTGDSRAITVNGGIRLTVAPGVNAELEATVVNGGISVQDGLPLSGDERSRQRVAGRLGSGGPRLVAQTTNGGVRIAARGGPGS